MATCKTCGAGIVFVQTEAGKLLPVNPHPDDKGNFFARPLKLLNGGLAGRYAHDDEPTPAGWDRYMPHFATCDDGQPRPGKPRPAFLPGLDDPPPTRRADQ